jgi:hypothetical protein
MPFCVFALRNGNHGAVNSDHVVRVEGDAPGCTVYFDEGKPWGVRDAFEDVIAALSRRPPPPPPPPFASSSPEAEIASQPAEKGASVTTQTDKLE